MVYHMKAKLLLRNKRVYADGAIREMVIWKLPEADAERPHGLKYRLYYGTEEECLVRYDNERGKGDHRHYGDREELYRFLSVEKLLADFRNDIDQLRGSDE